ncbi:MAG: thioredoxin family protein [Parvularculales bacterium]
MLNKIKYTLITLMILAGGGVVHAGDLTPTKGDDGIYHYDWYHQSFLEIGDDISESLDEGKILMVKFDQQGCIYCEKVALEVLTEPAINAYVREHFVVVQLDIYGNRDVTDLDGETLPENKMSQKWGVVFTPTIYFVGMPTDADTLPEASNATMPGAFGKLTFLGFLQWIREEGYNGDEPFQKYFGRRINDIRAGIDAARAAAS